MKHRKTTVILSMLALVFGAGSVLSLGTALIPEKEVQATKSSYWDTWITQNQSALNSGGPTLVQALKSKITQVADGSENTVSYNGLWAAYKESDPVPGTNGAKIIDYYGGQDYPWQSSGSGITNNGVIGGGYNREHSVPKSWFGEAKPAYSDLIHLMPTDCKVNSTRSNYAFGEVANPTFTHPLQPMTSGGIQWQEAGTCKLGPGIAVNGVAPTSSPVFEPPDQYKGDFARIYMYFAVRYGGGTCQATGGDGAQHFTSTCTAQNPYVTNYSIALFKKWHIQDPVNWREIERMDAVEKFQKNRNPFVDHPEWADKIFGTTYASSVGGGTGGGGGGGTVDPQPQAGTVTLDKNSLSFKVGGTAQTISATSSDNSQISWSVSPTGIVSLSNAVTASGANLTVAPKAEGTATLTAKATIGGKAVTQTASITVASATAPQTGSVTINKANLTLDKGATATLSATSSDGSRITWSTNNNNVSFSATSSNSGSNVTVTGVNAGTSTITAKATIGGRTYSDTCSVTINNVVTPQPDPGPTPQGGTVFTTPLTSAQIRDGMTVAWGTDPNNLVTSIVSDWAKVGGNSTNYMPFTVTGNSSGFTLSNGGQFVTSSALKKCALGPSGTTMTLAADNHLQGRIGSADAGYYWNDSSAQYGIRPYSAIGSFKNSYLYEVIPAVAPKVDLSHIAVETMNAKVDYFLNDTLDTTGLVVTAFYTDGSSKTVTPTSVTPSKLTNLGPQTITVTYEEGAISKSTTYQVNVKEPKILSSIALSGTYRTSFEQNDIFNHDGLVVTATYSDKSNADVTANATVSKPDMSLLGPQTVTVSYQEGAITKTATYRIEITQPRLVTSIEIAGYKNAFEEGDAFTYGGTVTAVYNDGGRADVTSQAAITGFVGTRLGNQTITVAFENKTAIYQVTVEEGTLVSVAASKMTTSYVKGAAFGFDGVLEATYQNGFKKAVQPTSVSHPDMNTGGTKQVTVSYTSSRGVTKSTTYSITVDAYRVVMEEAEVTYATISYATGAETMNPTGAATVTKGTTGYAAIEKDCYRLGSGSNPGSIKVDTKGKMIAKVIVKAMAYNTDNNAILLVGGVATPALGTAYADHTINLTAPASTIEIAAKTKGQRCKVQSITLIAKETTDIGKTADCTGLENFINTYMHMDYVESLGYCADATHAYYAKAKAAFNALNEHQRTLFTTHTAYSHEYLRLSTWATFNNEKLLAGNIFGAKAKPFMQEEMPVGGFEMSAIFLSMSGACVLGLYFIYRRDKNQA